MAHKYAPNGITFDDINFEQKFDTTIAYGQSKLANILHAKELAKRLDKTGIHVYVLHPGVIMTELSRHFVKKIPSFINFFTMPFFTFLLKTPFHGAQTTLFCILDDSIRNDSGKYYSDCAEAKVLTKHASDEDQAKKLWEMSADLVGLIK